MRWANWTGDQRCAPAAIVRPASEPELVATVRDAVARGHCVRAVGSGHSFTDIACTDGVLVDLGRMQRVLGHDGDRVTVEAGITLRRLGRELAARGLALENQGDIDAQTLAGATATGTHGTGVRFRNLSAGIAALRLVTAAGEALDLAPERDRDAFLAARVGLGALGVVSRITLRCVPRFTLRRRDEPRPLDETLDRLDETVDGSDHFEFWVFPYTRVALTRTCRRSGADPSPPRAWRRRLQEDAIENGLLELICRAGRVAPRGVPRLNRLVTGAMSASDVEDHSHRVFATRRRVRFNEMEYAIPRAHARAAVERALAAIERRRLPVGFPLEVRFAAPDDALLSTAHERESCYVAVHQYRGMEFETAFRAVEEIMDSYGGRPHWGKRHYQTAATLAQRYPGWHRFRAVRARLDPDGAFANAYVRRCLGG
ncbi:MAG TPA: D-arabinono-1,4-lactone oxidase [Solirubrobacteraceae bacterium]|nr:D-arabinono-1,4-lactone oxidase [Solirubrobacteraceae bacterium]